MNNQDQGGQQEDSRTTYQEETNRMNMLNDTLNEKDQAKSLKTIQAAPLNPKKPKMRFFKTARVLTLTVYLLIINLHFCLASPLSSFNNLISESYNVTPSDISLSVSLRTLGSAFAMLPGNYVLTKIGVKYSIVLGALFTALSMGLRLLINSDFRWYQAGSFLYGAALPFLNLCHPVLCTQWFEGKMVSLKENILGSI